MDAFFASVEQHDKPALAGRPVVVGGLGPRGVVSAASYEARRYGVHSAMPMYEARRRCPEGVFLPVRMARYQAVSRRVFAEFEDFSPVIEGLSLDEAFLDLSGSERLHGDGLAAGRRLKERIRAATGLAASVGIGPNKFLAKLASELGKPDGLYEISAETAQAVLDPLPVERLWGIGRKTAPRLHAAGIRSIGELRRARADTLWPILGRHTAHYQRLARGLDDRPVGGPAADRSLSAETTFAADESDTRRLEQRLLEQADRVAARLRRRGLAAGSVTLKLRTPDFATHTRSRRFEPPVQETAVLAGLARELLRDWLAAHPGAKLRLLGLAAGQLQEAAQLGLFGTARPALDAALDAVRRRFGADALRRGATLPDLD